MASYRANCAACQAYTVGRDAFDIEAAGWTTGAAASGLVYVWHCPSCREEGEEEWVGSAEGERIDEPALAKEADIVILQMANAVLSRLFMEDLIVWECREASIQALHTGIAALEGPMATPRGSWMRKALSFPESYEAM